MCWISRLSIFLIFYIHVHAVISQAVLGPWDICCAELEILNCSNIEESDTFIVNTSHHSAWKEKELIQWILQDYDKRSRPVFDNITRIIKTKENDEIQQITVEFGLRLIQILDLNEMEQVLTTSVRLLYRWKDLHLEWDPEEFQNIKYVFIPENLIWIPDIALYNYADERLEERRPCAAKVSNDGTVEWQPMAIYKSTCFVNIKYFPFDIQTCWLKFGPWTYDGFRVNITFYNSVNILDLEGLVPSPEWTILESWAKHTEIFYPCCDEPYPDISFYVKIRRSPMFYTYILILPCFLLSSLTLVLFWMPPESPAKMVLGMNIFIAFFLMMLLLQDTTPSASRNFPLIGTYYCVNMGIITLSTFLSCIIVNLHFRGDNMQEVPSWLKKLVFNYGLKYLCMNYQNNNHKKEEKIASTAAENQPLLEKLEDKKEKESETFEKHKLYVGKENIIQSVENSPKCSDIDEENYVFLNENEKLLNSNSELKYQPSSDHQDSQDNNKFIEQRLQIPFSPNVFPGCFPNSNFLKCLESYSPLHSPMLKNSLKYIDESQNDCYNKESVCSSDSLLQDTVSLSSCQLINFKSLILANSSFNEADDKSKNQNHFHLLQNIKIVENNKDSSFINSEQHKRICNDVKIIVKSLKYIQKLEENKENITRIFSEWRSVGLVLDRIFFYCYLFTIIFSIILYFPKTYKEE